MLALGSNKNDITYNDHTCARDERYNGFAESLTLVSSVSGGAVGSMFFLSLYGSDTSSDFRDKQLTPMKNAVKESSLDDVVFSLVYRDLNRILLPYLNSSSEEMLKDRGLMLEESWRNRGGIHANLSNWRLGVKEGTRPAAIFNSTIAETGEPLLLATTDLLEDKHFPARRSFYDLYHYTDLPVVTVVRLAATFPYITPAARKQSSQPEYHMIDGGYYDNPGVASLIDWLDEGLRKLVDKKEQLPKHVLIVQIRSFPNGQQKNQVESRPKPKNRGWFFQMYAPMEGLMNVRTTAQLVRDRGGLERFSKMWATSPTVSQGSLEDRIRFATFTFDGADAPLSWAMNDKQQKQITDRWKSIVSQNPKSLQWVHCTLDPKSYDCSSPELNGPDAD